MSNGYHSKGSRYQGQQTIPKYFEHIKNGFLDNQGNLRKELIFEDAKQLGQQLAHKGEKNTISQIRNFYDHFKGIEYKIKAAEVTEEAFARQMPFILMMSSKAAAAKGSKKVSANFEQFIRDSVAKISTDKDFAAFMDIFEAVLGYAIGAGLQK